MQRCGLGAMTFGKIVAVLPRSGGRKPALPSSLRGYLMLKMHRRRLAALLVLATVSTSSGLLHAADAVPAAGSKLPAAENKTITAADVTAERVGATIPVAAIGE